MQGSQKFIYTLSLEGIDGGTAEGFTKKESQQKACEITLKRLRTDGKFLDSIFAAKTERTRMEETPTALVPVIEEQKNDDIFIEKTAERKADSTTSEGDRPLTMAEKAVDELTLDDLTATPKKESMEDIIAKAEAEAYKNI